MNQLRYLAGLEPAVPPQRIKFVVESAKVAQEGSWLDGQLPLVPLAVPLWRVANDFSTFIPDSWRPYLTSQYLLWSSLLVLVLYPAGRLIAQEMAYRREERNLSLYD